MFTQKTTVHPIETNSVPEKCWEEPSVDLSEPLPNSHHVLVVQDLASRYPVAIAVKFKNAKSVIPVPRDTYDLFCNPLIQKSDNGSPFNPNEIVKFPKNRNNEQVKTLPGHPAAENVETVMKPLGKAMKIGNMQNLTEQGDLSAFLTSFRDTSHVSTGVPPAHMLFWYGYRHSLPHRHQMTKLDKLDKQIVT